MNLDFYKKLKSESLSVAEKIKRQFQQCSRYRVIAALCALGFFIAGYVRESYLFAIPGLALVLAFLFLVRWHNRIEDELRYYTERTNVAESYLARGGDAWKQEKETGEQYLPDAGPQAKDLDIFGKSSLYQYICMASTPFGKDCLASWLLPGCPDLKNIEKRQQAVRELTEKMAFAADFEATARCGQKEGPGGASGAALHCFIESSNESSPRQPVVICIMRWLLPIAALYFLISAILGVNS